MTVHRDGAEIGRAVRTQVRYQGALRAAWWAMRDDGSMSLHSGRQDAVRAIVGAS